MYDEIVKRLLENPENKWIYLGKIGNELNDREYNYSLGLIRGEFASMSFNGIPDNKCYLFHSEIKRDCKKWKYCPVCGKKL